MSAYVVDDDTIARIVEYLRTDNSSHPIMWNQVYRALQEVGYMISDDMEVKRLAQDLFNMNVNAVCQRYKDDKPENYNFEWVNVPIPSPAQAVKSLDCFLYQCSEGDVPESPLFKVFNRILNIICGGIVRNSREYAKAEWE